MSYSYGLPSGDEVNMRVDYTMREVNGVRVSTIIISTTVITQGLKYPGLNRSFMFIDDGDMWSSHRDRSMCFFLGAPFYLASDQVISCPLTTRENQPINQCSSGHT